MVFVRSLVLREAHVAMNAEDRAVHFGDGLDAAIQFFQMRAERFDESTGRIDEGSLVVVAMRVEPAFVVALGEPREKSNRAGGKTRKTHESLVVLRKLPSGRAGGPGSAAIQRRRNTGM